MFAVFNFFMALLFPRRRNPNGTSPKWSPLKLTTHLMAPLDLLNIHITDYLLNPARQAEARAISRTSTQEEQMESPLSDAKHLSVRVFRRLSQLTNIPVEKLMPKAKRVGFGAIYYPTTHEILLPVNEDDVALSHNHEALHASQRLLIQLTGTRRKLIYARQLEPSAVGGTSEPHRKGSGIAVIPAVLGNIGWNTALLFKQYAVAGAIAGTTAASALLDYSRVLLIKRAIQKYGPDGWIALHANGPYDPLFAGAILHSLNKQGFITPRGFTAKGEKWINSMKPQIEQRLQVMEENRRKMQEEMERQREQR